MSLWNFTFVSSLFFILLHLRHYKHEINYITPTTITTPPTTKNITKVTHYTSTQSMEGDILYSASLSIINFVFIHDMFGGKDT